MQEAIDKFQATVKMVPENIAPLVAGSRRQLQTTLLNGTRFTWESDGVEPYVAKLSDQVLLFESSVKEFMRLSDIIALNTHSVGLVDFSDENALNQVKTHVAAIQAAINEMGKRHCSNMHAWVEAKNAELEKSMLACARKLVNEWAYQFANWPDPSRTSLITEGILVEIVIRADQLTLNPPLELVRMIWYKGLHSWPERYL